MTYDCFHRTLLQEGVGSAKIQTKQRDQMTGPNPSPNLGISRLDANASNSKHKFSVKHPEGD